MNGREEAELKWEKKIQVMLMGKFPIFKDYYNSFGDETGSTKYTYIYNIIHFSDFMSKEFGLHFSRVDHLNMIKPHHINSYLNSFTYNKKTGEKTSNSFKSVKYSVIKHFFGFLLDNDIIKVNPVNKIKKPKDKGQHDIVSLTPEEIRIIKNNILNGVGTSKAIKFQSHMIYRDLSIVMLGITTGLRVSAIISINIEDVNFDNNTIIVVEKGDVKRKIYVPESVMEYIKQWVASRNKIISGSETNALFVTFQKKRISRTTVNDMLKRYTYNINKKITPHKLRSTAATNLLDKTDDIYLVAEVLGHKNLQNTRRYAKMSEEKKKKAADILGELV